VLTALARSESLDLHLIGVLVLCITHLALATFVLTHDSRARLNRRFALVVVPLVGWILTISLSLSATDPAWTVFLGKLAFAFIAQLPFCLLFLFRAFATQPSVIASRGLILTAVLAGTFSVLSLTPWLVVGAETTTSRSNFIYGPLHAWFGVYFTLSFIWAMWTLYIQLRVATGIRRLQLRYLLLGILLSGAGAVTTNLLIPLLWRTSRYSTLGPYFTICFVSFSAHAIVRHRLLDIRVFIRKSAVYALTVAAVATLFVVASSIFALLTHRAHETVPLQQAVVIAILIAVVFQPLRSSLNLYLNRYFHRADYDYRDTVREASRQLSTILDLDVLLSYLTTRILDVLNAEPVLLYLRDTPELLTLRSVAHTLPLDIAVPASIFVDTPLPRFLAMHRRPLDLDTHHRSAPGTLPELAHESLLALDGQLALPLFREAALFGVLIVGRKRSGDPILQDDLDLLSILASQAAIAIANALLYNQVILTNEYLENTLATMDSGVIAVDRNDLITLFNEAASRLTKLDPHIIKGAPLTQLPSVLADFLRTTAVTGHGASQVETVIDHNLSSHVSVVISTSPLRDNNGSPLGAVAVLNDLTRIKQLEAEQHRIERLASIGALASGVAHEIKNPLVAIRTFAELLPERFTDSDFRTNFGEVVIHEISRIDGLLARLRGLATRPSLHAAEVDIAEPLRAAMNLLNAQIEQSQITIHTEYDASTATVLGDPAQLEQLFLNILLNALDATPPGGHIAVRIHQHAASHVTVDISDSGTGIPAHLLGRIFDPFVTTKKQGSGLGLSICRGIADAHRATIRAMNNAHSSGATIAIVFPVAGTERFAQDVISRSESFESQSSTAITQNR